MTAEGPQMRLAREQAEKVGIPVDENGIIGTKISCAAAELIPTRQYANVTIGPVVVHRWVFAENDEQLKQEIKSTQSLCEEAVAEDRQTVHALIRQSDSGRFTE